MKIKNKTKNEIIVNNSKICKTFLSKTIGLMFSRKIEDYGLIFHFEKEEKISLHMFFVLYPIDVLFLDKNKKIIEIKRNFRPFGIFEPKEKSKFIIELPSNSTRGTRIGDTIEFV